MLSDYCSVPIIPPGTYLGHGKNPVQQLILFSWIHSKRKEENRK